MLPEKLPFWMPWSGGLLPALLAWPPLWPGVAPPSLGPGAPAVQEDGPDLVLRVPLPGVDPQSLEVRLDARSLHLRGMGRQEYREEREGQVYAAAAWTGFATVLPLPRPVDPARARARLQDGVLEVRAPRAGTPPGA